MHKILISISNDLAHRLRHTLPPRQRSKIIGELIEKEIEKRERNLYTCALEIEKDAALQKEMHDWDVAVADGLEDIENESW